MLVLSRKSGESIELPSLGIVIRVVDIKSSRVQIGIDAPAEVPIKRGELVDRSPDDSTQHISELITVRPDVLEELRRGRDAKTENEAKSTGSQPSCAESNCVRQAPSGYAITRPASLLAQQCAW